MFTDHHISLTSANDINEICQPLFNLSNITLFKFRRVFLDGSYIILSSNAEFTKKLSAVVWSPKDLEISKSYIESKRYNYLRTYKQIPSCFIPIISEFNIEHGLIVRETNSLCGDKFVFTTHSKDFNMYDFCLNNIDFIEKFIFYFKDKASPLIKRATTEQRLYFPESAVSTSEPMFNMPGSTVLNENLNVRKYIFNISENFISLSTQEMNSVRLLSKGYTIKEAAKYLNISAETVDCYLESARNKLRLNTNRQLISTYWKTLSLVS